MQTKFNEAGRSMVEMLGVLAVIGVLSVAGILGYKFAMNKYIANETVNELAIRANDIAYQMDKLIEANHVGEIEMELGNTTRMGYPIMARMSPQYEDYFEIFLSEVPSDICKLLLQSQWQSPYSIFVGIEEFEATADICNSAEKVELAYEFYKDMLGKEEVPEDSRHGITRCRYDNDCRCGTCSDGLCKSYCGPKEQCVKDSDNPHQLKCCPDDKVLGGLCCGSIVNGECCTTMGQCCSPDTPLWDSTGLCHSCTEDALITVENAYLCGAICENRTVMSGKYCSLKCNKNEFKDTSGKCRKCTDAGNYYTYATKAECDKCGEQRVFGYFNNDKCMLKCGTPGTYTADKPLHNHDGICFKCSDDGKINMQMGEYSRCTEKCSNRVLVGQYCLKKDYCTTTEKPLMDESGNCYACNTPKALPKQEKCTTACPNEREVASDGKCILKTCASGQFRTTGNACLECTDAGNYYTNATKAECDQCNGQRVFGYFNNDKCMLKCGTPGTYTEDRPLHNHDGICFKCSDDGKIDMRMGEYSRCTEKCPSRILIGQYCFKQDMCTTTEKPLMDESGNCYACNTSKALPKQEKCTTACPNEREVASNGKCILKACNDGQFKTTDNACLDCTDAGNYFTYATKAECDKCDGQRVFGYFNNDKCMLKCGTPGTYTEDKPLYNHDGICFSCNTRSSVNMNWGDKSRCESVCPNRTLEGNNCVFRECSVGMFSGNDQVCYGCGIVTPIATTKDECKRCLNREYGADGYCGLKSI